MIAKSTLSTFARNAILILSVLPAALNQNLISLNFSPLRPLVNFTLVAEDFSFTSPIFLGSVGGGILLIILGIILYCIRKKKSEQVVEQNKDNAEIKVGEEQKDPNSVGKPSSPDRNSASKEPPQGGDATLDQSDRKPLATPIEKREQKMTILFQNFSDKINNHTGDIPDHDRDDFLKPVVILNEKNEPIMMPSEASKLSKISVNHDLKKQSHNELICYTNEIRETPSNSFYEAKKDEIQHIIAIADEESKRETLPEKSPNGDEYDDDDDDFEEEFEDEDETPAYKEETPPQTENKKVQLTPPNGEQMTDFNERTKGRKLEIHKKKTMENEAIVSKSSKPGAAGKKEESNAGGAGKAEHSDIIIEIVPKVKDPSKI